jgi:RES domain-containing protein
MIVFRLSKGKYRNDLSGKGAELTGGRWNSTGMAMLYTSASQALCLCEIAVHLPLGIIPKDYYLLSLEVPDDMDILELTVADLPADWQAVPPSNNTQVIGDQFLSEGTYVCLKVPSAVVPGEYNYLFNPSHPAFSKIKIISAALMTFDSRLFTR